MNCGEKHHKAKLNTVKIQFILMSDMATIELARLFKVNSRTIRKVRSGTNWKSTFRSVRGRVNEKI